MSGLDLIRCVRADQQLSQLPIVLMTAKLEKVAEMVSKKELSGAGYPHIDALYARESPNEARREVRACST